MKKLFFTISLIINLILAGFLIWYSVSNNNLFIDPILTDTSPVAMENPTLPLGSIVPKDQKLNCQIEQCNGLDLTCGPDQGLMCPMIYKAGDVCRKYVDCIQVGNKCEMRTPSKFEECKSCIQTCYEGETDGISLMDECETKCGNL